MGERSVKDRTDFHQPSALCYNPVTNVPNHNFLRFIF